MEEFKKYFKFPLKMWDDFTIKVFTDDDKMAFDWLIKASDETKQRTIDKINGKDVQFKTKTSFRHEDGIIYLTTEDGTEYKMCRIRGWGMLTGIGGYNLDNDSAADIQDTFADYCVMMLNN